jgi:hypothetical protein
MSSSIYPTHNIREKTLKNKQGGFTAVEVVIGAVLMTMLITSMLHLIKQGTYLVELARDHTRVTQILQSEIEDMRTYRWTDLSDEGQLEIFQPEGNFANSFAKDYYCYIWNWDLVAGEKKEVYVYVSWKDSMNRWHYTYYVTRFTKDGLNDYYYRAV